MVIKHITEMYFYFMCDFVVFIFYQLVPYLWYSKFKLNFSSSFYVVLGPWVVFDARIEMPKVTL